MESTSYKEKIYSYDYDIKMLEDQIQTIKKNKRKLEKNNNKQSWYDWALEYIGY